MSTNAFFLALAANESVLALLVERDGRVKQVNRAFELVSGWSADEAAGRLWPSDFGVDDAALDKTSFSGRAGLPPVRAPAGVTRDVEWSGTLLPDEAGVLIVGGVTAHTRAAHGHLVKGMLDAFPGLAGLYTPAGEMIDACRDSLAFTGRVRGQPNPPLAEAPVLATDPALQARVRDAFARAARGEAVSFEVQMPNRPRGTPLSTIRATANPIFGEDGAVTHVMSFGMDDTSREQAMAELRASEARLNEAQRIAKVGSWHLLDDGTFECSNEVRRIFELGPTTSLTTFETLLTAVHPDEREHVEGLFRRSVENRAAHEHECRLRMPDGRVKWVRCRGETSFDGATEKVRTFGTVQDVTDAVLVEQELRTHSHVLMSLVEGVQFVDTTGIIRFANPALHAMFGYEPEGLVGKPVTVLNDATPEENGAIDVAVRKGLSEEGAFDGEFRNRRKDGSVFTSRARIRRIDGPTGLLFVSIQQDITDERRAMAALRENARLEAEARYRKDLLDELHHRVKNNLQAIVSLLRLHFQEIPDAALQPTLAGALHRVGAIALVHEQLSLVEVDGEIDLAAYLWRLADSIIAVEGRTASVVVEVEAPRLELPGESFMNLGMIVGELLVNALRHAFTGRPSGRIRIAMTTEAGCVKLDVIDDGIGMQRATTSTLGMQIIGQLARRMDGVIGWEEAPGGGTRASLVFTVSERPRPLE